MSGSFRHPFAPASTSAPLRRAGLLATVLLLAVAGLACTAPEPPPVLGEAPAFELTAARGGNLGLDDLAGRPVVLDFIFTRCVAVCPAMSAQMERIGRGLPEDARFERVSISLDPDHDTPEVLREYASKRRGALTGEGAWYFLTGASQEEIFALAREGFKLAVDTSDDPANPIVHSTRFVLIDGEGRIRGYYDALEPEAMEELRRDLGTLLEP